MDKELDIDKIFHALGDPTRRAMVERLGPGPMSVSRLAEPLAMSLAGVVQHLQILEEAGLVRTEKLGRVRTCQVEPAGLAAVSHWLGERRSPWERSLDQLGDFLVEDKDEGPE